MEALLQTRAHPLGPVFLGARVGEMLVAEVLQQDFAEASAHLVAYLVSEDVLAKIPAQEVPLNFQMV